MQIANLHRSTLVGMNRVGPGAALFHSRGGMSLDDSFTIAELVGDALAALPVSDEDQVSAAIVDDVIADRLPALLRPLTTGHDVEVRGSTGMGTRAEVPWVGVFPSGDTSAKTGLYLVYL